MHKNNYTVKSDVAEMRCMQFKQQLQTGEHFLVWNEEWSLALYTIENVS
jgi:uncharacterized protein YheU (UPF0270 family)